MFYSIMSAIAICLCTIPVIWGSIASRISAKQKIYARTNREAILAASALWRRSNTEVLSAHAGRPGAEPVISSVSSLDELDAIAKIS